MSESLVDASDVEETVTQVLTQVVQDGDDEDQMSVELLQEQVELRLEYSEGSLSKCQNFLGRRLRDFLKSKNKKRAPQARFLFGFTFCLTYYHPYESMTGPISQRVLSYLLT